MRLVLTLVCDIVDDNDTMGSSVVLKNGSDGEDALNESSLFGDLQLQIRPWPA